MTFCKIPLLLANAIATHVATTPPNPSTSHDDGFINDSCYSSADLSGAQVHLIPTLMKTVYWLATASEITLILAAATPSSPISQALLSLSPKPLSGRSFQLSPQFVVGSAFVLATGIVRWSSYRALGRLFTFNLSIQKGHQLITHGPYSIVRHPSYAGIVMFAIGAALMCFAPGSLCMSTGMVDSKTGIAGMYLCLALVCYITYKFVGRLEVEDVVLQKQFGEEWDEWAARVPYRLFPWIY